MTRLSLSLAVVLALSGCPSSPMMVDDAVAPDAGPDDVGIDAFVARDVGAYTRISEATASAARAGCMYGSGAWPWQTLGMEVPIGDQIPIRHFILLMQENRSFDSYFGTMPGIAGLPAGASNPNASGMAVRSFHSTTYCTADTNHEWNGSHREYNGGANDGFVTQNDPNGQRAMGYFDQTDLPFYWDISHRFAMSDHHHCSVLGPTWVNREFYLAATSFGMLTNNSVPTSAFPGDGRDHVIFQALNSAGVSWHIYAGGLPFIWGPFASFAGSAQRMQRMSNMASFYTDLAAGNLASVVWIDPTWTTVSTTTNDEHPPADPQRGQAHIRDVITRVMDSALWNDTAIILTYDEHGGFYDHVPPPAACTPHDGYPPRLGPPDHDFAADFDRLGFRVPLIVISPHARAGYVSPHVTDHTSILRLLEARFLMPALTARDANAWPMTDLFDFATTNPARSTDLAAAPIDMAQTDACLAAFP